MPDDLIGHIEDTRLADALFLTAGELAGKMILGEKIAIPTAASLGAIALIMAITVLSSLAPWKTKPTARDAQRSASAPPKV